MLILNEESISKLLQGRYLVDTYKESIKSITDENLKKKYSVDITFEMAKLGFRYDFKIKPDKLLMNFISINEAFNSVEFDKNYVFRHINKSEIYPRPIMEIEDFCINGSGCIKRGYIPCANSENIQTVNCYYEEPAITKFLKFNESEIATDFLYETDNLGISREGLYVPHPIMFIGHHKLNPETLTPKYCEGIVIKISEPRFDVFWGMDRFCNIAEWQWNLREIIQKNANPNL